MSEYPSNSREVKKPAPASASREGRVEQITTGKVIVSKPTHVERFKRAFVRDDGQSVAKYAITNVMYPAAKNMVFDGAMEILSEVLGVNVSIGARTGSRTTYGSSLSSKTNYNSVRPGYLQDPRERRAQTPPPQTRGAVSVGDINLASMVEANEVIARMSGLCREYGQATLADLFDLVGVTGEYTDEKYGWYSMDGARPHRTREGFRLDLPNMVQID